MKNNSKDGRVMENVSCVIVYCVFVVGGCDWWVVVDGCDWWVVVAVVCGCGLRLVGCGCCGCGCCGCAINKITKG